MRNKWTARNVPHASRLNHQHRRPPSSKASIPIEVLLRDEPVFSCAPGHHRRHPGAASRLESSDLNTLIKKGSRGFFGCRPVSFFYPMADWVRKLPHVRADQLYHDPQIKQILVHLPQEEALFV